MWVIMSYIHLSTFLEELSVSLIHNFYMVCLVRRSFFLNNVLFHRLIAASRGPVLDETSTCCLASSRKPRYLNLLLYVDDTLSYQRSSPYKDTVRIHPFPSIVATSRYQLHGLRNTRLLVLIHLVSLPIWRRLMAVSSKAALRGEANPV